MATKQFSRRGAKARESEESTTDAPAPPGPCGPCRGVGSVLSNAGGEQHTVVCPWCEGTKMTIPEHDAQEHPSEFPRC